MEALQSSGVTVLGSFALKWLSEAPAKCEILLLGWAAQESSTARAVAIHNPGGSVAKLEAGTFLMMGGPGMYCKETAVPAGSPKWLFNRFTEWSKDTAARASCNAVIVPVGAPREPESMVMKTLQEIHSECRGQRNWTVYAHSIAFGPRKTTVMPCAETVYWVPQGQSDKPRFDYSCGGEHLVPMVDYSKAGNPFTGLVRSAFVRALSVAHVWQHVACSLAEQCTLHCIRSGRCADQRLSTYEAERQGRLCRSGQHRSFQNPAHPLPHLIS